MTAPTRGPRRARRDPARLRPGAARRRGAGHPRPRRTASSRPPRWSALGDRQATYWAGRATLCAGPDDLDPLRPGLRGVVRRPRGAAAQPAADRAAELVQRAAAAGRARRRRRPTTTPTTSWPRWPATAEVLRHRDVADADGRREGAGWPRCSRPCTRAPPRRRAHRRTPWRRGEIDAHRTLRATLRRMGEPAEVEWRRRGTRPRRVVLLVDVSGSMSGYADALLRLAHRFVGDRRRPRRGRGLHPRHPAHPRHPGDADPRPRAGAGRAPARPCPTGRAAPGSARRCRLFLDRWGQRGMARGAVVVVFSDGWERGDPTLLGEQMARLQRLAHRVVWVNPHRGKAGYEPVQQGVVAALPHCRRLRRRSLAGDLRRAAGGGGACVRCCPSCWTGGEAGETVGVGTVVATFQSAPRPPGASMLVGPDGEAVGSVSGGCVEGAVYELGQYGGRARRPRARSGTASPTTTRSPSG